MKVDALWSDGKYYSATISGHEDGRINIFIFLTRLIISLDTQDAIMRPYYLVMRGQRFGNAPAYSLTARRCNNVYDFIAARDHRRNIAYAFSSAERPRTP